MSIHLNGWMLLFRFLCLKTSICGFAQFNSLAFDSIQFDSIQFNSIRFILSNLHILQHSQRIKETRRTQKRNKRTIGLRIEYMFLLPTLSLFPLRLAQLQFNSIQFNSIQFNSIQVNPIELQRVTLSHISTMSAPAPSSAMNIDPTIQSILQQILEQQQRTQLEQKQLLQLIQQQAQQFQQLREGQSSHRWDEEVTKFTNHHDIHISLIVVFSLSLSLCFLFVVDNQKQFAQLELSHNMGQFGWVAKDASKL